MASRTPEPKSSAPAGKKPEKKSFVGRIGGLFQRNTEPEPQKDPVTPPAKSSSSSAKTSASKTPAKSAAAIKKERMETILSSVKFSKVRSVA